MSFSDFGRSIGSLLPSGARGRTKARLLKLFRRSDPAQEYTPQRLALLVKPPSRAVLAAALDELEREGVVRRVFRVESPYSHGGIRDFASIEEIPETLHDWTIDEDIEVAPNLIRSVFKPEHV